MESVTRTAYDVHMVLVTYTHAVITHIIHVASTHVMERCNDIKLRTYMWYVLW
jgi:hypothetical protein